MAVVTIFSGTFCGGEKVTEKVATRLGYERVGEEFLDATAARFGVPAGQLLRAMEGPPPFLSKLTHERERNLACLRAAVADLLRRDNVVYHGWAAQLVPPSISHALRVCVIANLDYRIDMAVERTGVSEKQALRTIHKDDGNRLRWTQSLHGRDPYDASLYDVVLAMQSTTVEEAAARIGELALGSELKVTTESIQAADDFVLASQVEIALVPKGYDIEVTCSRGIVTVALSRYVSRLEAAKRQLESSAARVPGVKSVRCVPGAGFVPPALVGPTGDLARPSKILLVDDEREFVHTLSERLQARDLDAAVVYDGEEALSFVATDEPEVMVLDLKMPGIDGIEVLRRVKREHPAVEVIILTGHGSKKEEEEAKRLGAFAYLRKPVNIDLLTSTMTKAYNKIGKRPPPAERSSEE